MMDPTNLPTNPPPPILRSADEIRIAGEALTFAIQHDGGGKAAHETMALLDKYAEKIASNQPAARAYLFQLAADLFGAYCDRLACGFAAWARADEAKPADGGDAVVESQIQCPSCECDMAAASDGTGVEHVCPQCGYTERR